MRATAFQILLSICAGAFAHGLIENPPSRTWICGQETRPDEIANGVAETPACSTAFKVNPQAGYSYMAVVTHGLGRDSVSPLPPHVCGFGGETWKGAETPWDAPMDWPASPMAPGPKTFTWNIALGPHFDDTREFKYWITKADFAFSPARPLAWSDFETEPFCDLAYDGASQGGNPDIEADKARSIFKTRCILPERKGHHVIYGEWGRTRPTLERFHACVDGAFGPSSSLALPPAISPPARFRARPDRWTGPDGQKRDARGSTRNELGGTH